MKIHHLLLAFLLAVNTAGAADIPQVKSHLSVKQPGNPAVTYDLQATSPEKLPVEVSTKLMPVGNETIYEVTIKARQRTVYFNFGAELVTDYVSDDCEYYLPGFWYHRNLRSPKEAPSFHTSKSWNFREDRMSAPLTSVYNIQRGEGWGILRMLDTPADALTCHPSGEEILSGESSVGYLGFYGEKAKVTLSFGYPYIETPKRYIRKLTLIEPITTFACLKAGETKTIRWKVNRLTANDYGSFVSKMWEYCFDSIDPQPVTPLYSPEEMKAQMANYFRRAYVDRYPLKYHSGHGLHIDRCETVPIIQVGFCGRVLLNAFNAIEYGEQTGQNDLAVNGQAIMDSFLKNGFTKAGYFFDDINFNIGIPSDNDVVHSIRQQSEAIYAVLLYLKYEKEQGRRHQEWEQRIHTLLDNLLSLLKDDGHYARKFHDDGSDIDSSGGSTPSATSALVMGYRYFGDKRYLAAAKHTVDYLEQNIISKSDYFSSTLDANCEDKEAAIAAVTATYYLAKVTKGKEQQHYIDLCKQAAYFALSWYYLWDIPYAPGQMLGDLGLKTRGWGNVSVENNCADVFVFELAHIVDWLGKTCNEPRFNRMNTLINSSLNQLLPVKGRLCGIAVEGFYPEFIQSTDWDYGKNGRGFYNDIFAPGWATASLWELYSPQRTDHFLEK